MTTGIASGLGATWGFGKESSFGTIATVSHWLTINDDKVAGVKKTAQSQALHGGLYELASRRVLASFAAAGQVDLDVTTTKLGLLLQAMIGSPSSTAPVQQSTTTAYLQTHVSGDTVGESLTLQSGRPSVDGTINAFTYNGCKVTAWDLSVGTAALAKLALTFDGVDESISSTYVAPSYVPAAVLSWKDGALLVGGTVASTGGVITAITGGTAPSGTVSAVDLKGANGFDITRQQIGSLVKSEQLANAFRKYTGSLTVEFANLTDFYAFYRSDANLALQFTLTGGVIASSYNYELQVLIPAIKIDTDSITTDGPAILKQTLPFVVLDDGVNPVIQINYQSTDTTL